MKKEAIVISKKYILTQSAEGYVIVDTGSPSSYHESGQLTFGGVSHACPTSIIGVDGRALSTEVGLPVVGLVGMDVMNTCNHIFFDYTNAQIAVGDDRQDVSGAIPLPSGSIMGVPYIDIPVENRRARVFLDTGAPISYISGSYTNNLTPKDSVQDYNPVLGKFRTDIYEVRVGIGADTHVMSFGNLSTPIQMALKLVGIDGIIGYELFSRYGMLYQGGRWYAYTSGR